jgi:hypothetical protein
MNDPFLEFCAPWKEIRTVHMRFYDPSGEGSNSLTKSWEWRISRRGP